MENRLPTMEKKIIIDRFFSFFFFFFSFWPIIILRCIEVFFFEMSTNSGIILCKFEEYLYVFS